MSDETVWAELSRVAEKNPVVRQILQREGHDLENIYGALLRAGHADDELIEKVRTAAIEEKKRAGFVRAMT